MPSNRGSHGLKTTHPASLKELFSAKPATMVFENSNPQKCDNFLRKYLTLSNSSTVETWDNPKSSFLQKAGAGLELVISSPAVMLRELLQSTSDLRYTLHNFANDNPEPSTPKDEGKPYFDLKFRQYNLGMLGIISQYRNGLLPCSERLKALMKNLQKDKPDFVFIEELWEEHDQKALIEMVKDEYSIIITNIGSSHQVPETPLFIGSGLAVLVHKDAVAKYNISLDDIQFMPMERIGIDKWFSRKGFAYTTCTVQGKKMGFISSHFQAGLGVPKSIEELIDRTTKTTNEVRNDDLLMLCQIYDDHIKQCDNGLLFLSADMNINLNDPNLYTKYPAMQEVEKRFNIIKSSSTVLSKQTLLQAKKIGHEFPITSQNLVPNEDIDVFALSKEAIRNGAKLLFYGPNLDTEETSDHVPEKAVVRIFKTPKQ